VIDAKKGLKVPRPLAALALNQLALRWDATTGCVVDAKIFIEDDVDTPEATPHGKLEVAEIEAVKNTDGLGNDSVIVNGRLIGKTTIDFRNTAVKEDFAKNNTA
jgi:hypothetical protein